MKTRPGKPGSAGQVTEQSKVNMVVKEGPPNPRKQPVGQAFGGKNKSKKK